MRVYAKTWPSLRWVYGLRVVYGLRRNVNRKPRGADGMRVYGLRVNLPTLVPKPISSMDQRVSVPQYTQA